MLENVDSKNMVLESLQAFVFLVRENPVRSLLFLGAVPFGIIWVYHNSRPTGFALQVYMVTTAVFVYYPFRKENQVVKKSWYWKGMLLGGVPLHPLILVGLWYLDGAQRAFVTGGGGLFGIAFIAAALEGIVLGAVVNRFRPSEREGSDSRVAGPL